MSLMHAYRAVQSAADKAVVRRIAGRVALAHDRPPLSVTPLAVLVFEAAVSEKRRRSAGALSAQCAIVEVWKYANMKIPNVMMTRSGRAACPHAAAARKRHRAIFSLLHILTIPFFFFNHEIH